MIWIDKINVDVFSLLVLKRIDFYDAKLISARHQRFNLFHELIYFKNLQNSSYKSLKIHWYHLILFWMLVFAVFVFIFLMIYTKIKELLHWIICYVIEMVLHKLISRLLWHLNHWSPTDWHNALVPATPLFIQILILFTFKFNHYYTKHHFKFTYIHFILHKVTYLMF